MAMETNKKLSILYVLEILKEFSDENHLLTQEEIVKKIESLYGMKCERKSIGANIDALIDFGIDIIKIPHKGCFLGERTLEPSEVSFIIDALFSSRSIDGKQAKTLSCKLSKLLSKYQQRKYNYIYKSESVTRTNNLELFYNIEIIQEAIENHKKIQFKYNRPYFEKEQREKPYIVNPYFLINNQGRYYLICNLGNFDNLGNYKIDLISNIKLLDEDSKPITNLKGFESGIDIAKYANEHIYIFGNETVKATLKLTGEHSVAYIIDWFGKDCRIYKKDNILYADISTNEQAIVYWCLQYGEAVELISPQNTRQKIIEIISRINKKYTGEKNE